MIRGLDAGIDQGIITQAHWAHLADAQAIGFALLRCSQNGSLDPTFNRNVTGARAAKIPIGAWCVGNFHTHNATTVAPQDINLLGEVGHVGDIPVALDFEMPDPEDWRVQGVSAKLIVEAAARYLDAMAEAFNRMPLLYSYPYFLHQLEADGADMTLLSSRSKLWLAHYPYAKGVAWPDATEHFPEYAHWGQCTIWQVSDGRIGGFHVPNGCPTDTDVIQDANSLVSLLESKA